MHLFSGSIVALVTPFKNGVVDTDTFDRLIDFQIENNTSAIVPCGCTGEAATLTHDEQKQIIVQAIKKVNGRVPVIAGTGSNSTAEAVSLIQHAKEAGADGALSITPYYNKPTPEGQYQHYRALAEAADIPIMLYNVPSRTGISILPKTVARLFEIDNIVAIKEASGSLDQVSEILSLCDITVLSGDDGLTIPMMSLGATGVVSVAANIRPREMADMTQAMLQGDTTRAREIHFKLWPLICALFIETNPIPVKAALAHMGFGNGELRMPLCEMRPENAAKLKTYLD